jgi:hypothetical protein
MLLNKKLEVKCLSACGLASSAAAALSGSAQGRADTANFRPPHLGLD